MSFRFALDEDVDRGFRRIAIEQLNRAEAKLQRDGADPKAVHEVRKHLKRVRALLRLVRTGLGDRVFRAENHRFRDIGRMLAGARERHVMLQTLATLELRDALAPTMVADVRARIAAEDGTGTEALDDQRIAEATRDLGVGARAVRRLRLEPPGFGVLSAGLETGLRTLRTSFRHAYADGSDEAFHEWRKAVQHHWRHMGLLGAAWPALMSARARQARELSQLIGEDHDLGVLAAFVGEASGLDRRTARAITKACQGRQVAIRRHAEPLGDRLVAEGATGFARRVALYWDAARRAERSALPDNEAEAELVEAPKPKRNGRAGRATIA